MTAVRASRSLLLPGVQPPLTHLGATLLRHAVGAALRYGLYQLGLEPPPSPPLRIVRLRLLLEGAELSEHLGDRPGAAEVRRAMLDPGGTASAPLPARLGAALAFHRVRLRLHRRTAPKRALRTAVDQRSWRSFRRALSAWVPVLGDALLAELAAALTRRQARRRGGERPPVMSREAARYLAGRRARLRCLGAPDLAQESWAASERAEHQGRLGATSHPADPLRGRFRESWRVCLDALRPLYLDLATGAAERGVLDRPGDAFFFPFDLGSALEDASRPSWLDGAVAANRREYEAELSRSPAPEVVDAGTPSGVVRLGHETPDWDLAPLAPLP